MPHIDFRRASLGASMALVFLAMPVAAAAQSMSPMLVQTTPHYTVTLTIGPAQEMISPSDAMSGMSGEVMVSGGSMMTPSTSMGMGSSMSSSGEMGSSMTNTSMDQGMNVNHHLEVHVSQNGAVVDSVTPVIRVTDKSSGQFRDLPAVMGMYEAQMGMSDFHYGQNVYLPDGTYMVDVLLGMDTAQFRDVMVSGGSSMMAMGSGTSMGSGHAMDSTGMTAANPLVASDGATLAAQPTDVQALFNAVWGSRAGAEWVTEHNALLGMH